MLLQPPPPHAPPADMQQHLKLLVEAYRRACALADSLQVWGPVEACSDGLIFTGVLTELSWHTGSLQSVGAQAAGGPVLALLWLMLRQVSNLEPTS